MPKQGSKIIAEDRRRGRAASSNETGRFETYQTEAFDDGWDGLLDLPPVKTQVRTEQCKTIISKNQSPDISFDRSINPYRGCEHGCSYCYARSSHAYWGLSPGLDFETMLTAKTNAAQVLAQELSHKNYRPKPIALGTNTDPYQPIERHYRIMREILEVLFKAKHPLTIVTKSHLITRDIDLLASFAKENLVQVAISITSLDPKLARAMEPRASTPPKRLDTVKQLSDAGIPVGLMCAPMIPGLNDHELEEIMGAGKEVGAADCGYILLRLPREVSPLFFQWLGETYPDRKNKVLKLIKEMRGGKTYDSHWRQRMRGEGPYAQLLNRRFKAAYKRLGFAKIQPSSCDLFERPVQMGGQYDLF